ncbi:MAG TPA: thioredoxin domain-containing protein [Terriglobia bacterium]|nr:thioredoxin domain-containing protein [Terriglobia bacterium]
MRKVLLLGLTLAGLFDALYLLWVYASPSHPLVCTGIGCDVVRASHYAHLAGRPLPVYGVLMYAVLLVAVLTQGWLVSPGARRLARLATVLISGAGFAFSIYLTGLEAFVIHAYCAWCLGSAAIVTLIFVVALVDLRAADPPGDQTSRSALRRQFALVLAVMVVTGVLAFRYLSSRPELPVLPQVSAATLDEHLVRPDSHAVGSPNARLTVVEFGDFECPMCGSAQPMVQQMLDKYGNQVRYVFRQFPLNDIHPYAQTAAEASECAAEQGKFWEIERKFYQEQADLTEQALDRYAAEIGLNVKQMDQCLMDGTVRARVQQDIDDGKAVGVQATPTFFIGHQKLVGLTQYTQLSQLIDAQLAGKAPALQASTGSSSTPATASGTASNDASGGGLGAFGSSDGNPFGSSPSAELACTADEAKKQQPALIHTPDVQQLSQSASKPVFIDVRPASQFAAGHLPGALSIPVDQIEPRAAALPKDKILVLYESGKSGAATSDVCAVSRAGARVLLASGFNYDRVKVYQDGLAGWEKAGMPVAK